MANYQTTTSDKDDDIELSMCMFGGWFGLHHYYMGNIGKGLLYTFTGGLFIIGWFIDTIKIANKAVTKSIEKENNLLKQGYRKICDNLYINEKDKKINIQEKVLGFSQIIDCELIENKSTINNSSGNTIGEIKNDGRIKTKVNTISTETIYCDELYINITIEDFNAPNIKFDVINKGHLKTNSAKYKKALENANNILSLLKVIISKNNEKYIENGTVTKIEHRYITEETAQEQIEKLSELYKSGVLTEYEYYMKKQELLDKIK